MNLSTQFLFEMANIMLYTPSINDVAIALILSLVLLVLMRFVFLYHIGAFAVWHEKKALSAKKKILGDLILMKDIQSEMEKDIEQASLRATFQG